MADTEYRWTQEGVREWNRIRAKVDGIRGDNITNTREAVVIGNPQPRGKRGAPASTPGLFPVKVEKTGGSDGTSTTAATWTYTVRSIAWNGTSGGSTLGTAVVVTKPRPNGKMTFQTGSTNYGVAFYDGTTLVLWDAGEKPTTATC